MSMDETAALRAEVDRLRRQADDVAAVTAVLHENAYRSDGGDFAGAAELFTEDAILRDSVNGTVVAEATGRGMIAAMGTHAQTFGGLPGTHQLITNLTVEVDESGATARARSYITVLQAAPDFPLQPIACGTNTDRLVNRGGRWLIAEREGNARLLGDLSRHMPASIELPG